MKITKSLLNDILQEVLEEQGKWVGGEPSTPPPEWREGGQAANPEDREFQQSHPDVGPMSVDRGYAKDLMADAEAQRMKSVKYQLYKARQELKAARRNLNDAVGIAGVGSWKELPRNHKGRIAFRKAYRKVQKIKRKMKVGREKRQAKKLAAKGTAMTPQGTSPQVSARVRQSRAGDVEKRAGDVKSRALAVTGDAEKKMKAADIAGSAEKIGKKSARLKDKAAADVKRTSSPAYRKVQTAKAAHDKALAAYEKAQGLASYGPEYKKKAVAAGKKEAQAKKRLQAAEAALK
jgi:hypothetical protein